MRVLFLAQAGPSSQSTQHRVDFIATELERRGYECDVIYGTERSVLGRPMKYVSSRGLIQLSQNDYDVVVLNRDGSPFARLVRTITARRSIPLVFDIDDALYTERTIRGTPVPNPTRAFLDSLIRTADHVTTGSENIRQYAEQLNEDVTVVPTPVNTDIFDPERSPPREYESFVIGWMGVGHGHAKNLILLRKPLIELGQRYDLTFRIVSALGNDRIHKLFEPVEEYVEVDYGFDSFVSMERVAHEMATFDVAALPLDSSDEYMTGKSSIKPLEHLAMGIPVVASDFAAYGQLLTHDETGLLCETADDWVNNLTRLIETPAERNRLAENGLRMVQKGYTVERYVDRLESVFGAVVGG